MTKSEEEPEPEDKKPVKRKRGRPRNKPKETGDEEYKKKIQKALEESIVEYSKAKRLSQKQLKIINSYIEEHLSCFVLLGYTVSGEPVTLVNSPTPKDSDSLGTLLHKFVIKYMDPPAPQPPLF